MNGRCPECGRLAQYRWDCRRCAKLFRRPRLHWELALEKFWSKGSDAAIIDNIRRLHQSGKTAAEVAAELGLSAQALNAIRREIGLPKFAQPSHKNIPRIHWTRAELAELKSALASGMSEAEFIAKSGRTPGAVRVKRQRLALATFPTRRRRAAWPAPRLEKLKRLRADGHTFEECAPLLRTTPGSVAGAVHRYLKEDALT